MELHSPRRDPYNPVNKRVDDLKEKGFTQKFSVKDDTTLHDEAGKIYPASDISIINIDRFENRENKTENQMVIAFEANDGSKGYMVEKYGADEDETVTNFLMNADQSEAVHKYY